MSHVTVLKANIKDLTCLGRAAEQIGMEYDAQAERFRYYGGAYEATQHGALRCKNKPQAYEMGLTKQKDGTYDLLWDSYDDGEGLVSVVGQGAGKLLQEYGAQVAIKAMARQGMTAHRRTNAKGELVLTFE